MICTNTQNKQQILTAAKVDFLGLEDHKVIQLEMSQENWVPDGQ